MFPRFSPGPKWLKYYDKVAYAVLFVDVLFPLAYLSYIFVIMGDRKMYLPYKHSRYWLELNSYSLLPPFVAITVAPAIMWQVKNQIKLSDGDFYGIIGTMLGLGCISLFDSAKCFQYYFRMASTTDPLNNASELKEAMQKGVRGVVHEEYKYILTGSDGITFVYENLKDGYRVENADGSFGFLANPDNRTLPNGGNWTEQFITDKGVRLWTHNLQAGLHCCGSDNYTDWLELKGQIYSEQNQLVFEKQFGSIPPSCYCKYVCSSDEYEHEKCFLKQKCTNMNDSSNNMELTKRPGCFKLYFTYLRELYLVTFLLQLFLGILYILTLFVYTVNFAAVRHLSKVYVDDSEVYSLLRVTSYDHEDYVMGRRTSKRYAPHSEQTEPRVVIIKESRYMMKRRALESLASIMGKEEDTDEEVSTNTNPENSKGKPNANTQTKNKSSPNMIQRLFSRIKGKNKKNIGGDNKKLNMQQSSLKVNPNQNQGTSKNNKNPTPRPPTRFSKGLIPVASALPSQSQQQLLKSGPTTPLDSSLSEPYSQQQQPRSLPSRTSQRSRQMKLSKGSNKANQKVITAAGILSNKNNKQGSGGGGGVKIGPQKNSVDTSGKKIRETSSPGENPVGRLSAGGAVALAELTEPSKIKSVKSAGDILKEKKVALVGNPSAKKSKESLKPKKSAAVTGGKNSNSPKPEGDAAAAAGAGKGQKESQLDNGESNNMRKAANDLTLSKRAANKWKAYSKAKKKQKN